PISSDPVPINEPSQFDVTAAGIGLLYSWNFGDGTGNSSASSQSSISHTFAQPGRYLVSVTVTDPAGNETVASFTQLAHIPTTASRPAASSALVEITSLNEIWNVNPDNDSVGVLSTIGLNRRAVISVGENPRALAIAPDGRVWVVNKNDATVSVIDTETRLVQQLVSLKPGSRPHGIVFAGNRAYIALEGIGEVVQLNAITGAEIQSVSAGGSPRHLSVNAANTRLYVSTFITPPLPGEGGLNPDVSDEGGEVLIYAISANTLSASGKIVLQHSNRSVSEFSGPGLPNYLGPAVISPDGLSAWVPSKQDNVLAGVARGGEGMTFDQTVRAVTSYIDLVNETEILASRVDHDNASVASHAAFDPFGLTLFTSLEGNRQIAMIDVNTSLEIARFDAGRATQSLLVSADGQRLYSHDFLDRSVSVFDVGAVVYQGDTETPLLATVNMSSGEALPGNVLQGKRLFYDARDDRLAALNYMSCASCHNEAGHDGRTWDFTGLGEGLRNTIGLQGAGGMQNGLLHWSANFDELQDFEEQIRNFAGGSGLMSDSDFNEADRAEPLGLSKAGISTDLDALAAYLSSLDKEFISPYRNQDGSLTSEAIQGQTLFANAGCASCHTGDKFTDSTDTPNLHNVGTLDAASGSRLSETLDGIDTPTLLGVWSTPPYLHNGAALSIADAIRAHNTQTLNSTQLATLSAFVRQLSSVDAGVGGNSPTLTIQAPLAASTFEETELVSFQAVASDIEDGDISDSVAWLSNLDGALGTGSFTSLLSVGTHDIVASITDSEGLSETTSVVITVEQSSSTVLVSTQAAVVGSNNDAEQSPTGRMRITSSDLELVFDANGNQLVGLRFTDLEIPQGVEVVNAYLQFQADETHSISTNLNVVGEASDDSLVFTNLNGNISARPVTGTSVSWSPSAWDLVGEATTTQRSPNLNGIIQEIVTRPGWESGNALSIIVSGTGERVAESYDGSISGAPRLFVDYLLEDAGGLDTDGDGIPDSLDSDDDNDGFADSEDAFPLNASEWLDSDNDNIGNNADLDDDNDSVADLEDDFPLDATEWLDTDGDGIGNNADPDDDNDGALDDADPAPLDPAIGGSGILQFQSAVRSSADDAEERNSGTTNVRSTDLELVFDAGGNQQVGVRFSRIDIPPGANIVSAYIQFQADETGSAPTSLSISGEAIDNAAQYQSIANNISSRAKTAASVNWSPAPWTIVGQAGPDQRTPNLASLLQEIIARPGWVSGNSIAFIFEGSGERVAESFNGFPEAAPRLLVEYAFTNVDGNVAPTIDAGNDVSISVFGTASLSASITDDGLPVAPGLVSSVWSRVTGPGSVVFSPDNTASTTATFSQPGTYVLQITATDGQLSSFDQLTAVVAGESGSTVLDTRIVNGNDDAEERADGRMYLGSSDLEMTETSRAQTIGLRFDSQQIPSGSTILRAYVQFQTDEVSLVPTELLLHGEYSADAEVFSQLDDDLTSRVRTLAAASWAPATWTNRGAAGSDQQSPDLSSVIQEIINHPSWSEGNAIVILVSGTGTRTAESFEGSPSGAPLLHIEFQ
ncbi:MAG: PKD domain-containing protein, partial [Granulosicoccus sp.]